MNNLEKHVQMIEESVSMRGAHMEKGTEKTVEASVSREDGVIVI